MALSIRNPRVEELARQVADRSGETMTRAVMVSLEERLQRLTGRRTAPDLVEAIMALSSRCSALANRDTRSADEILGYGPDGEVL